MSELTLLDALQVCDTCKELDALRDSSLILLKKVRHDLQKARKMNDDPGVDPGSVRSCTGLSLKSLAALQKLETAVDTIYTQACVLTTSHHQLDVEIRQFIKKTVRLAKNLDAVFLASDRRNGDEGSVPFRSRNGIFVLHVDDKSAVQDPHSLRTAQEKLSRYERVFNGHFDLVQVVFCSSSKTSRALHAALAALAARSSTNALQHVAAATTRCPRISERCADFLYTYTQGKFTAIMQELGHPSKTAAKTFAETFLYLLDNLEGQKAIMIVYDCGCVSHYVCVFYISQTNFHKKNQSYIHIYTHICICTNTHK